MLTVDSVKKAIEENLYYLGTCGSCSSDCEKKKISYFGIKGFN